MSKTSPENYVKVMHALDLISQGRTPTEACRMANVSTFVFKAATRDGLLSEIAADAFDRGNDALADILLRIDTDPVYGTSDPKKMKVLSDNIKWFLSKRSQAKYGDKIVVENHITADKAITEALSRGKQRALERSARAVVVDAVVLEATDDVSAFL